MMTKKNIKERRDFVRAKRVLSIEYRLTKRKSKNIKSKSDLSTTQDMSVAGLSFYASNEFKKDDILEIRVLMSGLLDIYNGLGKVVRVERKKSGAFYLIAVKFIKEEKKVRSAKTYAPSNKNRIKPKE